MLSNCNSGTGLLRARCGKLLGARSDSDKGYARETSVAVR